MPARLLLIILLAVIAIWLLPGQSDQPTRQLAVPADELIAVELSGIGMVPTTGAPVVLLREPNSGSVVPIFIGPNEARAIIAAQRGIDMPRPMTHDLAAGLIAGLDATLERVIVDELRNGIYFGVLEIRRSGEDPILIDSRPSDGLALAVRTGAAILVAPSVLTASQDVPFEGLGDDQDIVTAAGVTVMLPDRDVRDALELPSGDGVLVTASTGLAALAGIQPGAWITEVNDASVQGPLRFLELINATPRGQKARIEFHADGRTQQAELDVDVPAFAPRRERRDSL